MRSAVVLIVGVLLAACHEARLEVSRTVPAHHPLREGPIVTSSPPAGSAAPSEREEEGPFYRWLLVPGRIEVFAGQDRLMVIPEAEDRFAVAPGYVVTHDTIQEDPLLLAGLPHDSGEPSPQRPQGTRLGGRVSIRGNWPVSALLSLDTMPQGGCAGCIEEYTWAHDHWSPLGIPDERPNWWRRGDGDPRPFRFLYPDGSSVWELYEGTLRERATFYADPEGKQRARRQRALSIPGCRGRLRVTGRFEGVGFADGGLLGVGADCKTGIATVERWVEHRPTSEVRELPGKPELHVQRLVGLVEFDARSSADVLVAFTSWNPQRATPRPYVAHFDGKRWIDLSPPHTGELGWIRRLSDGSLLMRAETLLLRHPMTSLSPTAWTDIPTPSTAEFTNETDIIEDPRGHLWLGSPKSVFEHVDESWKQYPLPPCPGDREAPKAARFAPVLGSQIVVVATCRRGDVLESTLLVMSKPSQVIRRGSWASP
jgi:hypothetical protein